MPNEVIRWVSGGVGCVEGGQVRSGGPSWVYWVRVNGVNKGNEECYKWCLPVLDQLGGRRVKNNSNKSTHQHCCDQRKFQQIPDPPAPTLKIAGISPSHRAQGLFEYCPRARIWSEFVGVQTL